QDSQRTHTPEQARCGSAGNGPLSGASGFDEIIHVEKPWGYFDRLAYNRTCTVKVITLKGGQRLSLQSHKERDELWIPLGEGLLVEIGDEVYHARPYQQVKIPCGARHRAYASQGKVRIVEVAFGTFDENDIERFSDDYGRADFERMVSGALREAPVAAVILAGGQGTRLRPITYEIPKALIPVHGKTITEHLFDLLLKYGVRDVTMSVGYLRERIKAYFMDGARFGLRVSYVEENEPLGTAGSLQGLSFKGPFIVSNGDELKDIDIAAMYAFHRKHKALATIALTTVAEPQHYGVALMEGERILAFVEKPKDPPSNLISAGFYILEPEVLQRIPDGFAMFEKDVFPVLAKEGRLYGFPFSGQWFDTGNLERYERALKLWKR
ncbi:hypothetical protein COY28_06075, partial [Candidatus Woesearchaeota archaeon CG_4_10_14_0_2_um_filter_57_5]